jgi:hypothetical protein
MSHTRNEEYFLVTHFIPDQEKIEELKNGVTDIIPDIIIEALEMKYDKRHESYSKAEIERRGYCHAGGEHCVILKIIKDFNKPTTDIEDVFSIHLSLLTGFEVLHLFKQKRVDVIKQWEEKEKNGLKNPKYLLQSSQKLKQQETFVFGLFDKKGDKSSLKSFSENEQFNKGLVKLTFSFL